MSVAEMKKVIHEEIDRLPDEQLPVVQEFLEQIQLKRATSDFSIDNIWKELVEKYDSTLKRLAQ